MSHVSCEGARVAATKQQQTPMTPGHAVQPHGSNDNLHNTSSPTTAQIISFESGSDAEAAANATSDAAAGGWFKFYDASLDDEPDAPAVEDLVADLVAAQKPAAILSLLQQLTHPSVPNFCIINCEAWQPLLLLLPQLLTSTSSEIAAAVQKLLLQQLAPELLDCDPEPLAQLLVVLLAAATASNLQAPLQPPASAAAACSEASAVEPAAAAAAAGRHFTWPSSVVQLLVVGLTKLSRHWHFLEAELAQQLCSALVDVLLQPLLLLLLQQPRQQQRQQGLGEPKQCACCLAEQLLLAGPSMGWWHRLNANAKSCRGLRQTAVDKGLVQVLLQQLQQQDTDAHVLQQRQAGDEASAVAGVTVNHTNQTTSSSSSSSSSSVSRGDLAECLVVHLLSGFAGNPAGRQMLLAVAQSSVVDEQQGTACSSAQQHQQQFAVAGCLSPAAGWDVLAAAASCLQRMAGVCAAGCDEPVAIAAAAEARRVLMALQECP